jgi:multidrug efflux pump
VAPARDCDRRRPVVSQILTLYSTPVIYLYLDRFGLWSGRLRG